MKRRWIFQISIEEGNDEFWESIEYKGDMGVEEMKEGIRECLEDWFQQKAEVEFIKTTI
jgi:hypothetical protein